MNKYEIIGEWEGYSRGYSVYVVEANSEEEAKERYWRGVEIERDVIRDDTEFEFSEAILIEENIQEDIKEGADGTE